MRRFAYMPEAYLIILRDIVEDGSYVAPNGLETYECLDYSFSLNEPGVPIGIGRKVGPKMMALDSLTNLSGISWPRLALREAPTLARFSDTLTQDLVWNNAEVSRDTTNVPIGEQFFQGAYGPRLFDQLKAIETELRRDNLTRRAVATMWRTSDYDPQWKDRPCTTMIQFMIRKGALDIHVIMRANDAWTGLCYDVFQFGQIQWAMANVLGLRIGRYYHFATSLHVYLSDLDKVNMLLNKNGQSVLNSRETSGPPWYALPPNAFENWAHVQDYFKWVGKACRDRDAGFLPSAYPELSSWYFDLLGGPGNGQ